MTSDDTSSSEPTTKKVKCYRAQRRRRRTQLVNEAVSRLEASLKCSDRGAFYRGLAELGC